MCCTTANWKREIVPDHKFDFIDVHEFRATGCGTRLQYIWLYLLVIKSFAVYVADVYTAIALLASNHWSGEILQAASKSGQSTSTLEVPFNIGKWIFTGCIIFSFLLLLWEARKSRAIVRSRDISFAYTNVMSQNWYSLRSYDHFCFFCQINSSTKVKDELSFFVFFTFKGWLRLLLADGPRAAINGITLYSFGKAENWTTDFSVYFGGSFLKTGIIITMLFTLVIWVGSFILLLIATVMYIPLLCYIQGNLKEYCCHKVDKRIAELMKRKTRKRLAKEAEIARKEAKTGKFTLPQPTLPKIGLKDEDLYAGSEIGGGGGSRRGGSMKSRGGGGMNQYQYPPTASSNYGGGGSEWGEKQSNAGIGTIAGSNANLQRPGYSYANSDQSLSTHQLQSGNYAESNTSFDDLTSRAAPMGMGGYEYGNSNSKGGRNSYLNNGESRLNGRSRMSDVQNLQAPSYHSADDEKFGGYDNAGGVGGDRGGDNRDEFGQSQDIYYSNGNNNNTFSNGQRSHDPYTQSQQNQQFDSYPRSQSQLQNHQTHDNYDQYEYENDYQHQNHQQQSHYDQPQDSSSLHPNPQSHSMSQNDSDQSYYNTNNHNNHNDNYQTSMIRQNSQQAQIHNGSEDLIGEYGIWEEGPGRSLNNQQGEDNYHQHQHQSPQNEEILLDRDRDYSAGGGGGGGGGSRRRQ